LAFSPRKKKEKTITSKDKMKALILVGGFGTRLRPLTLSVPKPLVDFANKPMILHQIEALKAAGVDEVVLAINYQPEVMMNFLVDFEKKLGMKITCSQETEPMGTAGPLALARDKLDDGSGEAFFVLNSDVISEYPLKEMIEFHRNHGGEATIMVTKVDEPSKYGVVVMDEKTGSVQRFVEKPQQFVGNKINAGIYLLSPKTLDRIELRPTSIEKEIFPKIAAENQLFAMVLPGFWMDIGQPRDYNMGLRLYLNSLKQKMPKLLASGPSYIGNVIVDESAQVGEGCLIGPDVSIGQGCIIEAGVRLSQCTIMRGVRVKKHACISGSIIGWHSTIGQWARIENMTVLGEDVHVRDEIFSNGGVVLPHKEIKTSILKPEIVM
jgi:mannose-1-phosphate guanylyltransferase